MDVDRKNDPTYPMRRRLPVDPQHYDWERPAQQPLDVEILRSIERPNLTAVFGTSTPPSGLSGAIRRIAFKYSESSYLHWIPLILADRIGIAEGVLDDLKHGHVPNVFAEAGLKADWTYARPTVIRRVLVASALGFGALVYSRNRLGAKASQVNGATTEAVIQTAR